MTRGLLAALAGEPRGGDVAVLREEQRLVAALLEEPRQLAWRQGVVGGEVTEAKSHAIPKSCANLLVAAPPNG